jgi:hypothetical protein
MMETIKRVKFGIVLVILFLSPYILLAQENDKSKPAPAQLVLIFPK